MALSQSMASPVPRNTLVAKQSPLWGDGPVVNWWAQDGFVHYYDERPDTPEERRQGLLSWQDAAIRLQSLHEVHGRQTEVTLIIGLPEERRRAKQFEYEFACVINQAYAQMQRLLADQTSGRRRASVFVSSETRDLPKLYYADGAEIRFGPPATTRDDFDGT